MHQLRCSEDQPAPATVALQDLQRAERGRSRACATISVTVMYLLTLHVSVRNVSITVVFAALSASFWFLYDLAACAVYVPSCGKMWELQSLC